MPSTSSLAAFLMAALVLLLTPGPGVLYVVTRSVAQGRRAGLVSAIGLSAGALIHVAAAAAGLSVILMTSAAAFGIVKLLGAGYLIHLGIRTLLARDATDRVDAPVRTSRRLFVDGVVVSALNPKIAVFFLAFLPQFVDASRGPVARQVVVLGLLYCAMSIITDGAYALFAGTARGWLGSRVMRGPVPRYVSGGVYLGLGVATALTGRAQSD